MTYKLHKILILIVVSLTIILTSIITNAATNQLNLNISTKTINNHAYKQISHNQIVLKWNNIDADYYKVYKYSSAKKKYILYKTTNGERLKISSLSPTTTYYFKVKACRGSGVITSKPLKVKTRNKTTGYFYKKVVLDSIWNGILITDKKATNTQMNQYEINGQKTAVKYNYSVNDKTLYIHVYAKFVGKGVNQKFAYYKNGKQYKTSKYTNKELVISGIKNCWNIDVKGNSYDFINGCNFKTKVIFHTKNIQSDQSYITFNIGNEKCYFNKDHGYWFYASNVVYRSYYNYFGRNMSISMPTNHQLKNNNKHFPRKNISSFKGYAAHEFGHVLGLDDAYNVVYNGKTVRRINKTTETGYYEDGEFKNIMFSSYANTLAVSNDIEMALQSQGMAINDEKFSFQSYKSYEDSRKYRKSKVIRK